MPRVCETSPGGHLSTARSGLVRDQARPSQGGESGPDRHHGPAAGRAGAVQRHDVRRTQRPTPNSGIRPSASVVSKAMRGSPISVKPSPFRRATRKSAKPKTVNAAQAVRRGGAPPSVATRAANKTSRPCRPASRKEVAVRPTRRTRRRPGPPECAKRASRRHPAQAECVDRAAHRRGPRSTQRRAWRCSTATSALHSRHESSS